MSTAFLRAALEVVYGTQDIWVGIPYVLIAAAVFIGGCIGVYVISYGIDYLVLGVERAKQYMRRGKINDRKWRARPRRSCRNIRHLFTIFFFFSGLAMVLWVSVASAGFNVWNMSLTMMGMSVVLTYTFMPTLTKLGSALTLHFTNALEVGQYWEFHGMGPGWDGIITSIRLTDVEMCRWDEELQTTEPFYVPINAFDGQWRKQNPVKEERLQQLHLMATLEEVQQLDAPPAAGQQQQLKKQRPPPQTQAMTAPYIGLRISHGSKKQLPKTHVV